MPYIDRDKIINAKVPYDDELSRYDLGWNDAIDAIAEVPTADVQEVKHGKWLWLDGVRCSNCNHKLQTTGLPSYCPNCGAKMRGEEDDC